MPSSCYALEEFRHHGGVEAWALDDTSYPKKGTHSVGVARQYCGVIGKQDKCQVAVTISVANELMSVPASYRLYLPQSWAEDGRAARLQASPRMSCSRPRPRWPSIRSVPYLTAPVSPRPSPVATSRGRVCGERCCLVAVIGRSSGETASSSSTCA